MYAVEEVAPGVGAAPACRALGLARASLYRMRRRPAPDLEHSPPPRPAPPRSLSPGEREAVLGILHCDRFVDHAPAQIHACLLDEGSYLCSPRTMYRILNSAQEVKERRDQVRRPHYAKPELLATRPNQVWSWDITKLMGPAKWTYFYLYVILDIFSRYVVGWMVAPRESAALAEGLISETYDKQRIGKGQLTLHADRGSSMKSKPVALLLADLGVVKTHSRPQVSNDNPFSESQFKTMKYRPEFPSALAPSNTAAPSVTSSSPGTTRRTTTAPSDSSPPPSSTTAWPTASATNGSASSPPPSPLTPSASSRGRLSPPISPRPSGSTRPRARRRTRMPHDQRKRPWTT